MGRVPERMKLLIVHALSFNPLRCENLVALSLGVTKYW